MDFPGRKKGTKSIPRTVESFTGLIVAFKAWVFQRPMKSDQKMFVQQRSPRAKLARNLGSANLNSIRPQPQYNHHI
jgi:hypothetical protein